MFLPPLGSVMLMLQAKKHRKNESQHDNLYDLRAENQSKLPWAPKVVETLLGKDDFRYLNICST